MMHEIPISIEGNVAIYDNRFAIKAPLKGRLAPALISAPIFLVSLFVFIGILFRMLIGIIEPNAGGLTLTGIGVVVFGYAFFSFVISIFKLPEALLLPEQQRIILRSERTKKVISEHPIDDIEVRIESVHHEDPSRTPMRWFTLFDTNRQKQIFAVRTAGPGGETYDTAELKEFFYEVMGKKE